MHQCIKKPNLVALYPKKIFVRLYHSQDDKKDKLFIMEIPESNV